jgi:hypothetical protein
MTYRDAPPGRAPLDDHPAAYPVTRPPMGADDE